MKPTTLWFFALALAAGPALTEVKIVVRPDGTKLLYNEGGFHRSPTTSEYLQPVPNRRIGDLIDRYATRQDLDPRLVQAVIQVESGYRSGARSRKGAMGLMQLMPDTARGLAVRDPYDPEQNIRGGTAYLRSMLDRFDARLEWALAAYNAGPTAVEQHRGVPPYHETRSYVRRVIQLYDGGVATLDPSPSQGRKVELRRDGSGRLRLVTLSP